MASEKKLLGNFGEDVACEWLKKHHYRILERNFTCRRGEVDIIAADRKFVVFAEVKLRKNADFGYAAEYVTYAKQRRVIAAAEYWLLKNPQGLQPRFDVLEIYAPEGTNTKNPKIVHWEDAYQT